MQVTVRLSNERDRLNQKYEKPEPQVNRLKETERQMILRYLKVQHPKQPACALIADLDRPALVEKEKRELEAQKHKRAADENIRTSSHTCSSLQLCRRLDRRPLLHTIPAR